MAAARPPRLRPALTAAAAPAPEATLARLTPRLLSSRTTPLVAGRRELLSLRSFDGAPNGLGAPNAGGPPSGETGDSGGGGLELAVPGDGGELVPSSGVAADIAEKRPRWAAPADMLDRRCEVLREVEVDEAGLEDGGRMSNAETKALVAACEAVVLAADRLDGVGECARAAGRAVDIKGRARTAGPRRRRRAGGSKR